jgi:hypothetical protein
MPPFVLMGNVFEKNMFSFNGTENVGQQKLPPHPSSSAATHILLSNRSLASPCTTNH